MSTTRIPLNEEAVDMTPAPIEPDPEMLYQLATMPPPESIDWKAEYVKSYRMIQAFKEKIAELTKPAEPLEKQVSDAATMLSELDGNSVCVELAVWDHLATSKRLDVEYKIWRAKSGQHYRAGTLEEAVALATEAINRNKPAPVTEEF